MALDSRIVVTGTGLVTPLGLTTEENWSNLRAGVSGIGPASHFDVSAFHCQAEASVPAYKLTGLRAPKNEKFMSPGVLHLMRAALEAVAQSGANLESYGRFRVSVQTGSGQVGPEPSEFFRAFSIAKQEDGSPDYEQLGGHASRLVDAYFPLRTLSNAGSALVAMEFGARGPSNNFVQGEVASALALNAGCRDLRENRCDLVLASGCEYLLTPANFLNFDQEGWLSKRSASEALRPFDLEGDGIVLGEGAAVLVLERLEDALQRGAKPLAEIAGIGLSMDAEDRQEMCGSPEAIEASIQRALNGAAPDFVVASGIGVPEIDRREAQALSGSLGKRVPVTAFKGQTGYLGAATSLVELILGMSILESRSVPPVHRHAAALEEVDCNIVADQPVALSSASGGLFLSHARTGQSAAIYLRPI